MRILAFLTLLLIGGQNLSAQGNYEFGTLPAINLNTRLAPYWKLNLELESIQQFKSGVFGQESYGKYDYILTDLALVASRKLKADHSLSGGYLIRSRNNDIFHRLIQQFTLAGTYRSLQLAHRFSADQTLSRADDPEYRFRYRISTELPLNGQTLDNQEFYFKFSNEFLHGFQSGMYDLEIRVNPLVGYVFTNNQKLEWGLDYRVDSFIGSTASNKFWVSLNWVVGI
jgi:hypothetical protein